jgi:ribosomal-protein-alanine N-acetyltransferase
MAKKEAPTIKTDRLILRRLQENDIPNMAKMFSDSNVTQYLDSHTPNSEHDCLKIVRARRETEWAITLPDTDEFIGDCMVLNICENRIGEIGYVFLREYWGQRYAFEAGSALVDYCFNTLGLTRLWQRIDNHNERSKNLAERLGFELVAVLPESNFGGRVADVAYYSKGDE